MGQLFRVVCILVFRNWIGEVIRGKHLKLLPLWIPFLPYYVVQTAGTTFFLAQADILGNSIKFLSPETSMIFVQFFSRYLIPGLLRPILKCFRDEKYKLRAALNLGMVFNFCCCIASWHVEAQRLHMFKKSESNMNLIFWLVPQFFLLGCTIGLVGEGLENLFNDLVPESEEQLGFAFNRFVEGMGKFISVGFVLAFRNWIGDTINTSRLDNYYGTLAFLTLWALFFFTYLSNNYDWNIDVETSEERDAAAPDDLSADVLPIGNDQNLISVKVYS